MITIRAGSVAASVCLVLLATGCSREQQDWRTAEASDSMESYGQFIQRHPDSELVTQARTRVAQLGEDRDWQHAGSADTVDAYREFLKQHPSGKWTQEARIRIDNFSLGEQSGTDAATRRFGSPTANSGTTASTAVAGLASPSAAATVPGAPAASGAAASVAAVVGTGTVSPSRTAAAQVAATTSASGTKSYALAEPGESAVPAGVAAGHISGANPSAGAMAAAGVPSPGAGTAGVGAPGVPRTAAPSVANSGQPAVGGYGVQLGAYSTEAAAHAEWRTLTAQFGGDLQGLREHVVAAQTPSGRIYRLQAAVGDEGRARTLCDTLKRHSQACVAVLPH